MASSSRIQKCPVIDVTAAAPAPAAANRAISLAKLSACFLGSPLAALWVSSLHVGVDDRQIERGPGPFVSSDETAIIEFGRRNTDATDQTNVHE